MINYSLERERNRVVFEDVVFSPNRMKLSFVSALISWAKLIPNVECFNTIGRFGPFHDADQAVGPRRRWAY